MKTKRPKSTNPLLKKKKLKELLDLKCSTSRQNNNMPKIPSNYVKTETLERPKTSLRSIQKLNLFSKNNDDNLDVLNLIIETNPIQYNSKKIGKKLKAINPLFTKGTDENLKRPHYNINTEEVFYKYNLLYGNNTTNLIRTYSPKMRPKSASVSVFTKKMVTNLGESDYIFTEEEVLELINAKCKDIGIDVRDNIVNKFREYCNTKCKNRCVDLSECYLGIHSAKILSNILYTSSRIARLNLTRNNLGDEGVEILINGLKDSLSLLSLNVTSNSISHKGGLIVFSNLIYHQSLIDLNISSIEGTNRNRLTEKGISDIECFLKKNRFICSLNIAGNSIRDEGFILLSNGLNENVYLQKLNIANNEIHCRGLKKGLNIIKMSKIFALNISNNSIGDEGISCLADALKNFQNLKKLDVSFCNFEAIGFFYLLNILQNVKRIESLNVSGNNVKNGDFDYMRMPFINFGVKNLNMSKCSLGNKNTLVLGECLKNNETIRVLNISHNGITDQGFKSFQNLFTKNNTIEKLDVSSNFISDVTAREFVKSMKFNRSLKKLNFYDNQLHNEMRNVFLEILETNKSLVSINLVFNRIQMKTIDEINHILKINSEKQKSKFLPNLVKSIKNLQFDPDLFHYFTENIKSKKKQQDLLYKKVRQDDKLFTSLLRKDEKKIENKILEMDAINTSIKDYENKIKEIKTEIYSIDNKLKEQENIIGDKMRIEKTNIIKIKNDYLLVKADYESTKKDLDAAKEDTLRKVQFSVNKLNQAKKSYNTMLKSLEQKQKYYNDITNPDLLVPIGSNNIDNSNKVKKAKENEEEKKEIVLEEEDAMKNMRNKRTKSSSKIKKYNVTSNRTTELSETKANTRGNITERSAMDSIATYKNKESKNNIRPTTSNKKVIKK